jgi:ribosomal protein S18 acetylase RimI-like enzyme
MDIPRLFRRIFKISAKTYPFLYHSVSGGQKHDPKTHLFFNIFFNIRPMDPSQETIRIRRAVPADVDVMLPMVQQTLLESHGHSASAADMASYVERKMSREPMLAELSDEHNWFYLLYADGSLVGYAKIIFNAPNPNTPLQNVTKLERIYLLRSHYGQGLAQVLFDHLLADMKSNNQEGVWLNVWKENPRAIAFYRKNGFDVIGEYDFVVSDSHANPNHVMYKVLQAL